MNFELLGLHSLKIQMPTALGSGDVFNPKIILIKNLHKTFQVQTQTILNQLNRTLFSFTYKLCICICRKHFISFLDIVFSKKWMIFNIFRKIKFQTKKKDNKLITVFIFIHNKLHYILFRGKIDVKFPKWEGSANQDGIRHHRSNKH